MKMKAKIYFLSTCSTCTQILKRLHPGPDVELQDIKTQAITPEQIDGMKAMAGKYENLFSRRALKYKEMGLESKELTEQDYRSLILEEYTFLKRPVMILGNQIFVGNAKRTVEEAIAAFRK
jgi:arsenate reductase (glutaredoxin)